MPLLFIDASKYAAPSAAIDVDLRQTGTAVAFGGSAYQNNTAFVTPTIYQPVSQ